MLRSPFPVDPGYERTVNYLASPYLDSVSVPRVRPEAQEIAKMHTVGTIAMLLKSEPCQAKLKTSKYSSSVNHHVANKRRIKEIQLKTRQRQIQQASVTVTPPRPSSSKYSHIKSKVKTHSTQSRPQTTTSEQYHETVNTSTIAIPSCEDIKPSDCRTQAKVSLKVSEPEKSRNFILRNITSASKSKRKCQNSSVDETHTRTEERREQKHKKGVVPKYLLERKEQWRKEEEERIASLPDPAVPPGHVLMPKTEQRNTLNMLQDHHTGLLKELQALSLTADTLRIRERRKQLENKLAEIDDALKIFSRPKVFIKVTEDK